MLLDVNLPNHVVVEDYHAFSVIQTHLAPMIKGIKVREIGYSSYLNGYVGLVYLGNLSNEENAGYMRKIVDEYMNKEE